VTRREVALDALIGAVGGELSNGEFTTIIDVKDPKLVAALLLHLSLDLLDGVRDSILGRQQDDPHVAGCVVGQQQEVVATSWSRWRHGPREVIVDELQLLLRTVMSLLREGAPALLRRDAGVANLLGVLDHRHAAHHGVLAELV
jgi:hypothetical protein